MRIAPPSKVYSRAILPSEAGEVAIRYAAAYGCTLLAILAAKLHISDTLALSLAVITLLGLPISLFLRRTNLRIGTHQIQRPLLNSAVVTCSMFAALYHLVQTEPGLLAGDFYSVFMLRSNPRDTIQLLMETFLIFAAFRCWAIVTDKDAVWCAAPSFSVLLLMIVVDRGPAVVSYFVLWTLLATVLFASDHYAESRAEASGYVPSLVPGEGITMSARSLAATLFLSMICAVGLSMTLTNQEADGRRSFESWIGGLASRLTQLALSIPETSVNSGPERQIDFSSGPGLPTRAQLWQVGAWTSDGRAVKPFYWRMFTLSQYNGSSWSQTAQTGNPAPLRQLDREQWPRWRPVAPGPSGSFNPSLGGGFIPRTPDDPVFGYDLRGHVPGGQHPAAQFAVPRVRIRQRITSLVANVGFIPALPAVTTVRMGLGAPDQIRVRQDNSVNMGFMNQEQRAVLQSEVPPGEEFGNTKSTVPVRQDQRPNPSAQLSDEERRLYLQLPPTVPARVREFARATVHGGKLQDNDYQRARRIAFALQTSGVYTLHPSAIPEGRDAVDYFLFDSGRRGYCTYFASALTVLCRTINIPARVVSGFANPEWQPDDSFGILREANAHAWTEVWVPGWGWATLDATPADDRGDNAPEWWENWADLMGTAIENGRLWVSQHRIWAIAAGALLLIAGIAFAISRHGALDRQLRRLLPARRVRMSEDAVRKAVFDAYRRAARGLARRFRRRTPWETPSEWLTAAETTLNLVDSQPLHRLTGLYLKAKYTSGSLSDAEVAAADAALADISWQQREGSDSRFAIVRRLRQAAKRTSGARDNTQNR